MNGHLYKKIEFDNVDQIQELHLPVSYLIRNKRSFETEAKNIIERELKNSQKKMSCRIIEKDCQTIFNSMEGMAKKILKTVEDVEGLLREMNLPNGKTKDPTMLQIFECIKCRDMKKKYDKLSSDKSEIKNSINIPETTTKKLRDTNKKFAIINLAENLTIDAPNKFNLPIMQKRKRNDKPVLNQQLNPSKLPEQGNPQPLVMKQANMRPYGIMPSHQLINSNQPNSPQDLSNQVGPSASPPTGELPQQLCLPFTPYPTVVYVLPTSGQYYPGFTNVQAPRIPASNVYNPENRPVPAFPPTRPGYNSYSPSAAGGHLSSYPLSAAGGYSNPYPPSAARGYSPPSQSYNTGTADAAPLYYQCIYPSPAYSMNPSLTASTPGKSRNWRFEKYEARSQSYEPSKIHGKSVFDSSE